MYSPRRLETSRPSAAAALASPLHGVPAHWRGGGARGDHGAAAAEGLQLVLDGGPVGPHRRQRPLHLVNVAVEGRDLALRGRNRNLNILFSPFIFR